MAAGQCALTVCSYRGEGFGSRFAGSILPVYGLARRLGCYYLHTPLEDIGWSNQGNGHDPDTDRAFNQYILNSLLPKKWILSIRGAARYQRHLKTRFFAGAERTPEYTVYHETSSGDWIPGEDVEYLDVPIDIETIKNIIQKPSSKHRVLRIDDGENTIRLPTLRDRDFSLIADLHADLLENYIHSTHRPETYFSSQELNIAVHIRKFCSPPDFHELEHNTFFRPGNQIDRFYCSFIRNLSRSLPGRPLAFHIYSHSRNDQVSDFDHFAGCTSRDNHRVVLHINEHPIVTFHHLLMADLFLMGSSTMSYAAHFYASGMVVSTRNCPHPCMHPHLPHVQFIGGDGVLPASILSRL